VVDDAIDEANETVIVTMGAPVNATQGVTTVHTATINDNDNAPTVAWTTSSQTNDESVTTVTVTAELSASFRIGCNGSIYIDWYRKRSRLITQSLHHRSP
jgi:hypothetical protein